jgi:phosphonopyruvate decarboxylase
MIPASELLDALEARGATLVTGVPCSLIAALIDAAAGHPRLRYVGAANEGESAAIAVGAWLGGGAGVVLCQNSGLGNMVSPIASLAHPARVPFLMVCGWRGEPGFDDEPQHELMGRITRRLLGVLDVSAARLPPRAEAVDDALDRLWGPMSSRSLPACLLVSRGVLEPAVAVIHGPPGPRLDGAAVDLAGAPRATRAAVIERVLEEIDDDVAIIATTGKTSRELFTLCDGPRHFYMVGAMGCASALGLGVALQTGVRTVVLDGDGAALMRLENLATIGAEAPANLVHVVLDNGVHDSTGGQPTASSTVRFGAVAQACGYRRAISCSRLDDIAHALRIALGEPGPHLVHVRHRSGSMRGLGRPDLAPAEVARRFRAFLTASSTRGPVACGSS